MKSLVTIVVLAGIVMGGVFLYRRSAMSAGPEPPDFYGTSLQGEKLEISALKGQPVLLVFWATWCPSCNHELPILAGFHERYSGRGLRVVAVTHDDYDEDHVRGFVEYKRIPFPVIMGSDAVSKMYEVNGVPTNILIDRNGRIVYRTSGFVMPELEDRVVGVLK